MAPDKHSIFCFLNLASGPRKTSRKCTLQRMCPTGMILPWENCPGVTFLMFSVPDVSTSSSHQVFITPHLDIWKTQDDHKPHTHTHTHTYQLRTSEWRGHLQDLCNSSEEWRTWRASGNYVTVFIDSYILEDGNLQQGWATRQELVSEMEKWGFIWR